MKRRITLSIALALTIILVSLTSSDSSVQAQPPLRFRADTGIIIPGPHQKVRLTITGFGEDLLRVQFRQITYSQEVCNGGVCKSSIVSNQTSGPLTLMSGEAASFDIPASVQDGTLIEHVGVRGTVESNRRDVRVNALIINSTTGEVVAYENMFVIEL